MTDKEIIDVQSPLLEQSESIKLSKNSRSYGWEIRLLAKKGIDEKFIERLEEVNNMLLSRFEVERRIDG